MRSHTRWAFPPLTMRADLVLPATALTDRTLTADVTPFRPCRHPVTDHVTGSADRCPLMMTESFLLSPSETS